MACAAAVALSGGPPSSSTSSRSSSRSRRRPSPSPGGASPDAGADARGAHRLERRLDRDRERRQLRRARSRRPPTVATSPGVVFAVTALTFVWSAALVAGIRVPGARVAPKRTREKKRGAAREVLARLRGHPGDPRSALDRRALRRADPRRRRPERARRRSGGRVARAGDGRGRVSQLGGRRRRSRRGRADVRPRRAAAARGELRRRHRPLGSRARAGRTLARPALALLFLGLLGVGNTLVDVAGVTILQRAGAGGSAVTGVRGAREPPRRRARRGRVGIAPC